MVKKQTALIGISFIVFIVLSCVLLFVFLSNMESVNDIQRLPRMSIILKDVSYDEIKEGDKETEYSNNMVRISDGKSFDVIPDVVVKGRGNSTWLQDKKPLQIEFKNKISLLNMGKSKKWILIANALDDSNLRNEAAFYLEYLLDGNSIIKEEPVELYIDDKYEGLYYLTRKIKIGRDLVSLRNNEGVLVELDNLNSGDNECYYTKNGNCLVLKDIVFDEVAEQSMKDFVKCFDDAEEAIKDGNWKRIEELIDVDSFARYFILSELTINPDAYASSLYFYKDGEEDKIHVGPGWDFDYAFNNKRWMWDDEYKAEPDVVIAGKERSSLIFRWFYDLVENDEFNDRVKSIFIKRMFGRKNDLIRAIENKRAVIRNAAIKNNEFWGLNNFDESTEELIEWIKLRYEFMEKRVVADSGFIMRVI